MLAVGVLTSFQITPGRAYTGGPQLIEIIGWSEKYQRVYFKTDPQDESGDFGTLWFFDLKSKTPGKAMLEPWVQGQKNSPDSLKAIRLASLRKSLVPLARMSVPSNPSFTQIVSVDTVNVWEGPVTRYHAVTSFGGYGSTTIAFTCYGRSTNCLAGMFAIPGREERVCIFAYFGYERDLPAETQTALLLPEVETRIDNVIWHNDH